MFFSCLVATRIKCVDFIIAKDYDDVNILDDVPSSPLLGFTTGESYRSEACDTHGHLSFIRDNKIREQNSHYKPLSR